MAAWCYGEADVFTDTDTKKKSIYFGVACVLYCMAQIPFSMAISTFFSDSKAAT